MDQNTDKEHLCALFAHCEPILTVSEVSRILRVTDSTIYNLIHNKALPAIRISGQWRLVRDQVVDVLGAEPEAPP